MYALGCICLVMPFFLTACAGKEEPATQQETSEEPETQEVSETENDPEEENSPEEESSQEETGESESAASSENLLANGDLSQGLDPWMYFCQDGECDLSVDSQGRLDVDIKNIGTVEHGVQVYHDGFSLEEGCEYKISFDAEATIKRPLEMRFQLNGGDYHAYFLEYPVIEEQSNHYEYTFTMEEATDPAPRFCFNMGLVNDTDKNAGEHHVYLDNLTLQLLDDSGKVEGSGQASLPDITVDQIGYFPGGKKTAVIMGSGLGSTAKLIDEATGQSVLEAAVGQGTDDPDAGEKTEVFDFSSITKEGTYHVEAGDAVSPAFTIGKDVYDQAFTASIKMLYYQRCGEELPSEYAGNFAHPACHTQKAVLYEDNGKSLDVSGGWHDAGDYGRYPVAAAKAVADLLLAYENYPEVFDDAVGIPESGNGVPDILDEAKFELEWLLKMQAENGGVYHKVTCRNFPGEIMPQEETDQLVIMPVSTTATADFAAVMCMASRVYEKTDASFAKKAMDAAKKAIAYLDKTPRDTKGYKNPSDVATGEYEDTCDVDERFWAYAEAFKTTGDKAYEEALKKELPDNGYSLGWQGVAGYGGYAYLSAKNTDSATKEAVLQGAKKAADGICTNTAKSAFGSSISGEYPWGSNLTIANNGMYLLLMKDYTGQNDDTAASQLHYLFGNNATRYSYLTGFGTLYADHPHHRPSQAMGKTVPGMVVGGPNSHLDDPYVQNVLQGTAPAKCYADNSQSYSTNEITIYWNSPLIYLLAGELSQAK